MGFPVKANRSDGKAPARMYIAHLALADYALRTCGVNLDIMRQYQIDPSTETREGGYVMKFTNPIYDS